MVTVDLTSAYPLDYGCVLKVYMCWYGTQSVQSGNLLFHSLAVVTVDLTSAYLLDYGCVLKVYMCWYGTQSVQTVISQSSSGECRSDEFIPHWTMAVF